MKSRLLASGTEKTYAVVFDKGEEVLSGLKSFAEKEGLTAARFSGIGALSDVVLGYFDREQKDYRKNRVSEQVEVLVLAGNIVLSNDQPKVHAHLVIGKSDGTAWGGHLLEGHVWPTLEVLVEESPAHLRRIQDEETGLALIA